MFIEDPLHELLTTPPVSKSETPKLDGFEVVSRPPEKVDAKSVFIHLGLQMSSLLATLLVQKLARKLEPDGKR